MNPTRKFNVANGCIVYLNKVLNSVRSSFIDSEAFNNINIKPKKPTFQKNVESYIQRKKETGTSTDLDQCLQKLEQTPVYERHAQANLPTDNPSDSGIDLLEKMQKELLERIPYHERGAYSAPIPELEMSGDIDMLEAIRRKLLTS